MWNFSLSMTIQMILRVTLSPKSSDPLVGGGEPPEIHIRSSNPGKSSILFPVPEYSGHLNRPPLSPYPPPQLQAFNTTITISALNNIKLL